MVGKHGDIRLAVMRILLNQDEDISMRGIARQLDLPSSHIHYHLKKMVEMGILKRETVEGRVYYTPQKIFTEEIDNVLDTLLELSDLIDNSNETKLGNCIMMFLRCYPSHPR